VIIKEILGKTVTFFKKYELDNARLDAEVLLADLLKCERIDLYVNFDYPLKDEEIDKYRKRIIRRIKGEPVAYITGKKEFMSLDIFVNEKVLIPRPETELLVEKVKTYYEKRNLKNALVVDLGTGSAAIIISLAYYLKSIKAIAVDNSELALKIARKNIKHHNLDNRITLKKGDFLKPILEMKSKEKVDIIVSNPPYIESNDMNKLADEVKKEPSLALDGGEDGLDSYRKIIPDAANLLKEGGLLALEIGCNQADMVTSFFNDEWENVRVMQDYAEKDRLIFAERK